MHRKLAILIGFGFALNLFAGAALADDDSAPPATCHRWYQLPIAPWAQPSNTPAYVGYYVGGGCAWYGEPRRPDEGTYGWDYQGCYLPRRVWLAWCRCRYQGGTGAYATDGHQSPFSFPTR
jgi:hypothetical protein